MDVDALVNKPDHPLVWFLLYMLSMDTFLTEILAQAVAMRDHNKVDT